MAEYEYLRAGNSEATEKKALNALFDPATGVLSGLVVTQTTTASGSVLIASGSALVHPSAVSASLLGNDTSKTLDVFTANPVGGLPRNDIVAFDQITASIAAIIGVPNATPTDPTVPATSVALARLRHLSPGGIGATTIPTAQIDQLAVPTYLRGTTPDDTGWIAPSLASEWSVFNSETIGYRRLNGVIYLRGRGSSTGTGSTAFTLPAGFCPGQIMIVAAPDAGGVITRSNTLTSGAVTQATLAAVTGWSFAAFPPFPADA